MQRSPSELASADPDCPHCQGTGFISQRTAAIWADEVLPCECRNPLAYGRTERGT